MCNNFWKNILVATICGLLTFLFANNSMPERYEAHLSRVAAKQERTATAIAAAHTLQQAAIAATTTEEVLFAARKYTEEINRLGYSPGNELKKQFRFLQHRVANTANAPWKSTAAGKQCGTACMEIEHRTWKIYQEVRARVAIMTPLRLDAKYFVVLPALAVFVLMLALLEALRKRVSCDKNHAREVVF